ncbi:MAG: hypothetical protein AAGG01_13560 [Planctomycetota bacterium]
MRHQPLTVLALLAASALTACSSTSVQTFSSPAEATAAIVQAAEAGDQEEATRIFDSFARSSVQRDRVYASLFDAAEARYDRGNGGAAANILTFVTAQYPAAVAAREALVYSLFIDRASGAEPTDDGVVALAQAVEGARESNPQPSPWIDLAATQVAIDRDDLSSARADFSQFLERWDGEPAGLMEYVEDIDRYLQSH